MKKKSKVNERNKKLLKKRIEMSIKDDQNIVRVRASKNFVVKI